MTSVDLVLALEPEMTEEEAQAKLEEIVPELQNENQEFSFWSILWRLMHHDYKKTATWEEACSGRKLYLLEFITFLAVVLGIVGFINISSGGLVAWIVAIILVAFPTYVLFDHDLPAARRIHREMMEKSENSPLLPSIEVIQQKVATYYTDHFEEWKEEEIGEDSALAKRKRAFSAARQEAQQGLAFWKAQDETDETRQMIRELTELKKFFGEAETALDERIKAAQDAVAEVKGHLEGMSGRMTLAKERERVRRLKEQADVYVVLAREELEKMRHSFIREIQEITAIGAEMERRQLKLAVENGSVGSLFAEAKRISRETADDTNALKELARKLHGDTPEQLGNERTLAPHAV